jgi:hypothetical protein
LHHQDSERRGGCNKPSRPDKMPDMDKSKDQERETQRKRDDILRTMLSTPPKPKWRPTNIRKKKARKPVKSGES